MTNTSIQDSVLDQKYEYSYDRFAEISSQLKYPMTESVFFEDNSLTKEDWTEDVITLLLRIRSNQSMYDVAIKQKQRSTLRLIIEITLLYTIRDPKRSAWIRKIYNSLIRKVLPQPSEKIAKTSVSQKLDRYLIVEQVKTNSASRIIGIYFKSFIYQLLPIELKKIRLLRHRELLEQTLW
jgi:hypothetical protein